MAIQHTDTARRVISRSTLFALFINRPARLALQVTEYSIGYRSKVKYAVPSFQSIGCNNVPAAGFKALYIMPSPA